MHQLAALALSDDWNDAAHYCTRTTTWQQLPGAADPSRGVDESNEGDASCSRQGRAVQQSSSPRPAGAGGPGHCDGSIYPCRRRQFPPACVRNSHRERTKTASSPNPPAHSPPIIPSDPPPTQPGWWWRWVEWSGVEWCGVEWSGGGSSGGSQADGAATRAAGRLGGGGARTGRWRRAAQARCGAGAHQRRRLPRQPSPRLDRRRGGGPRRRRPGGVPRDLAGRLDDELGDPRRAAGTRQLVRHHRAAGRRPLHLGARRHRRDRGGPAVRRGDPGRRHRQAGDEAPQKQHRVQERRLQLHARPTT